MFYYCLIAIERNLHSTRYSVRFQVVALNMAHTQWYDIQIILANHYVTCNNVFFSVFQLYRDYYHKMHQFSSTSDEQEDFWDENGETVLTGLCLRDGDHKSEIVNLVQHGASVHQPNADGMQPVHIAAQKRDMDLMEAFLDVGGDINAGDSWGRTPLMICIDNEDLESTKALVRKKAHVNIEDKLFYTPLMHAAMHPPSKTTTATVKVLLESGVDVNRNINHSDSALVWCVRLENLECVKLLLQAGANVNSQNICGKTALMSLALNTDCFEKKEMLSVLLKANPDITLQDHCGLTAFMLQQ